jgi:hypothetical protein
MFSKAAATTSIHKTTSGSMETVPTHTGLNPVEAGAPAAALGSTLFGLPSISPASLTDVTTKPIPFFPRKGNIADIKDKENCRLMTAADIESIKLGIRILKLSRPSIDDDRYPKRVLTTPWNIISKGEDLYAIYFKLGTGKTGRVWAVQNLRTGKWRASKILPVAPQGKLSTEQGNMALRRIHDVKLEYQTNILLGRSSQREPIGKRASSSKNPYRSPFLKPDKNEIQWSFLMDLAEGLPVDSVEGFNPQINLQLPTIFWVQMALDAIQALKDMHEHAHSPMLHCDLKPDNLVYHFAANKMTFIDLGRALPLIRGKECQTTLRGSFTHWTSEIRMAWREALLKRAKNEAYHLTISVSEKTDTHAILIVLAEIFGLFEPPIDPQQEEFIKFLETFDPKKNYLVDKSHPLFACNTRITDPVMREEILDFLNNSTNGSMETPTLDSIAEFFERIKLRCKAAGDKIKVGILNIQDYLQYTENDKENLISALQTIHEVQLVDTGIHTDYENMKIKWELEQAGIHIVMDKVHTGPGIEKLIAKTQQELNSGKLKDCHEFHQAAKLLADYVPPALVRSHATGILHT